jgi:hypothetical protein
MADIFRDWWAFVAFMLTGAIGWVLGLERNRWRIDDVGRAVGHLEERVKTLEAQGMASERSQATSNEKLDHIREDLREIKKDLRGKEDRR